MSVIQYFPALEMLFFNLFAIDRCCHRKYSVWKTALALFIFSAALFFLSYTFADELNFRGDGSLCLLGFIYLIPMKMLYRENIPLLTIIICTCWVYTLGILSLSLQAAGLFASDSLSSILIVENLLFFSTILPFYKVLIPKYVFVIENLNQFQKYWHKFIALGSCLNFGTLALLNTIFLPEKRSLLRILLLVLLLVSNFMSCYIFYRVVVDSIKISRLELAAFHDPLTGLGNRTYLWDRLNALLETSQVFSILFMDLNRFKKINDEYGHIVGDEYLKHFAKLSSAILQEHGSVYRFGGDEFVAVCPGTVPQSLIERLRECREWEEGAPCPFNQVSIGVLLCKPPHKDADQILQQVDHLMYQNKPDYSLHSG